MKQFILTLITLTALSAQADIAANEINPFDSEMLSATPEQIMQDNALSAQPSFNIKNLNMSKQQNIQVFGFMQSSATAAPTNPYANDPSIRQDPNGLPDYMFRPVGVLTPGCIRERCAVYAYINKREQTMYLYLEGRLVDRWLVSTGTVDHETPLFDRRPTGPIFDAYSSKKFPGGDYEGLGNMPYAVFIKGGFALHGTPAANFRKLGTKQSHGCIRQHSDNGYIFNRLVRKYGLTQTWVTVVN